MAPGFQAISTTPRIIPGLPHCSNARSSHRRLLPQRRVSGLPRLPRRLPRSIWRASFSPIEDQGQLGSCTAQAAAGLLEYFERHASGKWVDASRLFLYKVERDLMGVTGDTGAYGCSTLSTEGPLEECVDTAESGGVAILIER